MNKQLLIILFGIENLCTTNNDTLATSVKFCIDTKQFFISGTTNNEYNYFLGSTLVNGYKYCNSHTCLWMSN